MRAFIDVIGASGRCYRFRALANPALLPRMAGNFLFVRSGLDGPVIVGSGSSGDLSLARDLWPTAAADHFAEAVYIHLNVARRERSRVQVDIVERHAPAMVAEDLDLGRDVTITHASERRAAVG